MGQAEALCILLASFSSPLSTMANSPGHWVLFVVCFEADFGRGGFSERCFLAEGRLIDCIVAMQTFVAEEWVLWIEFELEDCNYYDADGHMFTVMPPPWVRVYSHV